MGLSVCEPGDWTVVPDQGAATIISATERGLLIDTSGALSFADRWKGFLLAGGQSMVVAEGTPIRATPANDLKRTSVRYNKA
jgi:hypothetical protein